MNSKRTTFVMPSTHTIRITPYYLLGLFEGEGSFSLSNINTMAISFSISLTAAQAPLIKAVKDYLTSVFVDTVHLKSFFPTDYMDIINEIVFIYPRKATPSLSPERERGRWPTSPPISFHL